jgi:hypothetical protein
VAAANCTSNGGVFTESALMSPSAMQAPSTATLSANPDSRIRPFALLL